MDYPIADIQLIIDAVSRDAECQRRIRPQSAMGLHGLLRMLRAAGFVRNSTNIVRDWRDPSRVPVGQTKTFTNPITHKTSTVTAGATPDQMENSATQREMCFGLARATERVIDNVIRANRGKTGFTLTSVSEGSADAHYAALVKTNTGTQFIIDWWMTLEIDDPVIMPLDVWKGWPESQPIPPTFKQLKAQYEVGKMNIKLPTTPIIPGRTLLE